MKSFTHIIPSDQELIDRIKVDDGDAFTEIYTRYWKVLLSVAANKIKDLEEAEEIVQDIFVQLWKRRHELVLTGALSNYLAVSVKYRVIKVLAKRQSRQKYMDYQSGQELLLDNSTQEWLDFEELKLHLSKLVARLPEKCKLVYQMSKESYYSQKQIAEELNISEKTVEAHLAKAAKTLRAGLTQFLTLTIL
jgi:RNA polymerase sigma-70 factor (family 1)